MPKWFRINRLFGWLWCIYRWYDDLPSIDRFAVLAVFWLVNLLIMVVGLVIVWKGLIYLIVVLFPRVFWHYSSLVRNRYPSKYSARRA